MVAETGYPYTFDNADSEGNNIGSADSMVCYDYEVSVSGQAQALRDVFAAVAQVNSMGGLKDVKVIETRSQGQYKIVTLEETYGNGKTQTQELRLKEKNGKWVIVL